MKRKITIEKTRSYEKEPISRFAFCDMRFVRM